MAVKTTNNKPLNPRGQDQSPLAFNRAKLYSGKALDFDGVNDKIEGSAPSLPTGANPFTTCFYYKETTTSNEAFSWGTMSTNQANGYRTATNKFKHFFYANDLESTIETPVGTWVFAAVTFDGTTRSIYINGQLDVSDTPTGVQVTGTNYKVGLAVSSYWDGNISNVRVFNTALTAAQVADLYNNPEKIVPTGVADTALKLWLPMMEGAGTTAINGAPDALGNEILTQPIDIDADFNANAGGVIVDADTFQTFGGGSDGIISSSLIQAGKTYRLEIQGTTTSSGFTFGNGGTGSGNEYGAGFGVHYFTAAHQTLWFRQGTAGTTDITTFSIKELKNIGTISGATWTHGIGAPVAQNAVIDWNKHPFNVSTDILIPQGLTAGRDIGGSLFENVRKQGALNLDGNSWAEVHDNASLDLTTGVSVECWYYHVDQNTTKGIFGKWIASSADRSYTLYMDSNNKIAFTTSDDGGGTLGQAIATTSFTDDNWYHILGTFDGSNVKIYVNGTLERTTAASGSIYNSDVAVAIGHINGNLIYDQPIAQPRIYNRALTAEEVQRNYNAGKNIYK